MHQSAVLFEKIRCRPGADGLRGPHRQRWQRHQRRHPEHQNGQVEIQIAQIGRHRRQRIGAEQAQARCQVIAVFAQVANGAVLLFDSAGTRRRQRGFNRLDTAFAQPMDQRRQPGANVAATGHRREVVETAQQPEFGQRLDQPEIECGAANAATGQRQAGKLHLNRTDFRIRLRVGRWRRCICRQALPGDAIELLAPDRIELSANLVITGFCLFIVHFALPPDGLPRAQSSSNRQASVSPARRGTTPAACSAGTGVASRSSVTRSSLRARP